MSTHKEKLKAFLPSSESSREKLLRIIDEELSDKQSKQILEFIAVVGRYNDGTFDRDFTIADIVVFDDGDAVSVNLQTGLTLL